METAHKISLFQGRSIRRMWYNKEWWFVLEDITIALTDSTDPKQYLNKMRQRDEQLSAGWVQIVHTLPVDTSGGKQKMNCVNTEGAFRIIQSIPSPKAEPFKLWLAKVGYERIQEIENAEGYSEIENVAKKGGRVAGNARQDTEKELGRSILSKENYFSEPEKKEKVRKKLISTLRDGRPLHIAGPKLWIKEE